MAAKKKSKKKQAKAAAKKSSTQPGYDLIVSMLKRNPKIDYATVRATAEKRGVTVYPIQYGRAQAQLGIVKTSKRSRGKAGKTGATGRRGPGRPRKSGQMAGLESIIAQIQDTERERDRALRTLEKIRDLIDAVI